MSEIVTRQNEVVVAPQGWGAADELDMKDIEIPRIWLMQKMSELVSDEKAKEGDLVDSVEGKVFGETVDVVIFHSSKSWRVFENGEYLKTEPVTSANSSAPINEGSIHRDLVYNYFCLLADDKDTGAPYALSMAKTSLGTARKLNAVFLRIAQGKEPKPSAAVVVTLGSRKEKNDKGAWRTWDFTVKGPTPAATLEHAKFWYNQFATRAVTPVVAEDMNEISKTPTPTVVEEGELPF